ncbi:MAG: HAMP domain-containing protein, partial [Gammaproteobacteria bacterium]
MRQAVLVTLSVGLVLAGIQFYTGFQTELARLNDRLNQLLSGAEPAARRALLTLDTQLAKEVIDGLRAYPFVVQAALTDETGDNLARFDRLLINSPTRWITAALTRPLDTRTVRLYASPYEFDRFGTLSLTLDRHLALQPFYEHLSSRLLGVLLSAALLALILSWVFYRSVTRPLRSVSEQLGQADTHHPDRLRLDMPPGQAHNEIGRIVSAC